MSIKSAALQRLVDQEIIRTKATVYDPHPRRAPGPEFEVGHKRARTFADRCKQQFLSAENAAYLAKHISNTPGAPVCNRETVERKILEFVPMLHTLIDDDPLALRGAATNNAARLWDEVKRFNRAFVSNVLDSDRAYSYYKKPRGRLWGEEEPYHMRAFEADSLRPPGLESLNDNTLPFAESPHRRQPLFEFADDPRALAEPMQYGHPRYAKEGVASFASGRKANHTRRIIQSESFAAESVADREAGGDEDVIFGERRSVRTPALGPTRATRMGRANTPDDYHVGVRQIVDGQPGPVGEVDRLPAGATLPPAGTSRPLVEAPDTRFMRYEGIPFWQDNNGARANYERDSEEVGRTLSSAPTELGSHVRRFRGMTQLRHPRGSSHRRLGPTV